MEIYLYKTMDFEDELEEIGRQEWLELFDDPQIMNATRTFLEWLYTLPEDFKPKFFMQITFR